jgi:TolA-binding protein
MKRTPPVFILFIFCLSLLGHPTLLSGQSSIEVQVAELQATLERQDKILRTLQGLTAEQARTQGELNRLPLAVEDIDNIRRDVRVIAESLQQLQRDIDDLRRNVRQTKNNFAQTSKSPSRGEPLVIGLLALQSGDINRAVDQLQPLLTGNNEYRKDDLMMVLGNGYLQSGYPEQAASHLSTLIRTFPQSQHLPSALFLLGQAFGDMRDDSRKYTIWKALIEEYPNHPIALRATRFLEAILR